MKIGNSYIGKGKPVFIVAEAGINHNGDIKIAKQMILEASKAGANAIKFQTIFPEELYSEKSNTTLFNLIKKWSFNKKQHIELKKFTEKNKLEFLSTPVGKKSAKLLEEIRIKSIKIASGELTNHQLIKIVAKTKKPLIVSTGMSTIQEIASAVSIIKNEKCPFALLHCNASYPTPTVDANLSNIKYLNDMFNVPIGYSDHTIGNEACITAVSLGACIIEKHFTLDKNMEGPDQKLSADVKEFTELVTKIRTVEKLLGHHRTGPTNSEKKFVKLMRKSLAITKTLPKGTKIKKSMLTSIRPGTGIPPTIIDQIIGMRITKNVKKGTILRWDMF